MNTQILKMKDITSNEKLILLLVEQWPSYMFKFDKTSQDIATELGLKRKDVLDALGMLEERDFIQCEIGYRSRIITLTERLNKIINPKTNE